MSTRRIAMVLIGFALVFLGTYFYPEIAYGPAILKEQSDAQGNTNYFLIHEKRRAFLPGADQRIVSIDHAEFVESLLYYKTNVEKSRPHKSGLLMSYRIIGLKDLAPVESDEEPWNPPARTKNAKEESQK